MHEFTMSAFPHYADGSSGDVFAEVSAETPAGCFSAMATEVTDWLPRALGADGDAPMPSAIELTLEWSGASAPTPARPVKPAPRIDAASKQRPREERRMASCASRRRFSWAGDPARVRVAEGVEVVGAGA